MKSSITDEQKKQLKSDRDIFIESAIIVTHTMNLDEQHYFWNLVKNSSISLACEAWKEIVRTHQLMPV